MKKMKTGIGVMLALLCCILMCTGVVYATGDDTDGTELQVAQPVILEVQLGPQWAGVEFQLKTDAGLYPGTPWGRTGFYEPSWAIAAATSFLA